MDASELRSLQAPLKAQYRDRPAAAVVVLEAGGDLDEGIACRVDTGRAAAVAGLHPATGGTGELACSGDMLLQALVACAGVTLRAVSTSLELPVTGGSLRATGELDFRGTLGMDRDAAVGFRRIDLAVELDGRDLTDEHLATLHNLTERYCVVYQTLRGGVEIGMDLRRR